jgi:sugar phosphate isomerase/epimerase
MTSRAATFPLGVSLHTLDQDQRLETMRLLRGTAVSAVELWEPTFPKEEGFVREARRTLEGAGVVPRTVHAAFGASLDISSPDAGVRTAGLQAAGDALDLAVRLGARIVVLHPSSEPIGEAERPARLAQARQSVAAFAERAHAAGCQVAIELLPRTCLGRSAAELLGLLGGLDHRLAGACLDTNHLMADYASLPAVAHALGPRLLALHCSDYDGVDEKHWPPGRGVIDWAAFLAALRAVGFAGPLHYEAALDGQTPAERLASLTANYAALVARCPKRQCS